MVWYGMVWYGMVWYGIAQTRDPKKRKVISDCWTFNENSMVRDPANLVHAVKSVSDLDKFKSN